MTHYTPIDARLLPAIADTVGTEALQPNPDAYYDRDASELRCAPDIVVLPTRVEQIQALMRLATVHRFPVTPRGAGTGLAGGSLPVCGGAVLSLERMNRILRLSPADLAADVEPGVITQDLRNAAANVGLFYPPDPASLDTSTIGGNAATNAGGPACVKYGVTRDYILGVSAVLPDGELIRAGGRTRKYVVGYDMCRLLVGSEGTLGIITELTLKLIPKPQSVAGMAVLFPSLRSAMHGVQQAMTGGCLPSALEFMDAKCLRLVEELLPFPLPSNDAAMLIVEVDGRPEQLAEELACISESMSAAGALETLPAPNEKRRAELWGIRRQISLRIHDAAAMYASEDVTVPLSRIADLADAVPDLERRHGLTVYAFGHAGDGNIHLNVTSDKPDNGAAMRRGIVDALQLTLDLDGAISGEHGLGAAKSEFAAMELSPRSIALQKAVKDLFDPLGILNPGKIFV